MTPDALSKIVANLPELEFKAKQAFLLQLLERIERDKRRRFFYLFPDEDHYYLGNIIHARSKYPKHLEFFQAGAKYMARCFMAANRAGKSEAGGFETASHLTGLYRDWWPGRKFTRPVKVWVAGKTNETTRDIVQAKLLGAVTHGNPKGVTGTGLIPGDCIGEITWKAGVADLVDTVKVKHVSGDWSELGFKSYQQGRGSFEGTERDFIWLDEEPPEEVFDESMIRLATTNGCAALTFTPLDGLSKVVLGFLPKEQRPAEA
jgi:phage terminase large subunit-like protein